MLSRDILLGGRYRLTARIATGGMGEIWRATDTVLDREVALKALLPALVEDPGFSKRFKHEAKTLAALTHPSIVRVYDYGETDIGNGDRSTYLVMEYVPGTPLSQIINERGRMDYTEVLPLIGSMASALQHAHDHQIIHRDIKPSNILLRPDGTPVLTDFGIARSAATGDLTGSGEVMGTAAYIAPEQAEGGQIGPGVDMYSLGVVAYHALAGVKPFESDNPVELALHHVRTPPPPLADDVPLAVRQFVEKSLAKSPQQRHTTANDMAYAASTVVAPGPAAPPAGVMQTPLGAPEHQPLPGPGSGARPGSFTAPYPVGEAPSHGAGGQMPYTTGNGHSTQQVPIPGTAPVPDGPHRRSRLAGILAAVLVAVLLVGGLGLYLVLDDSDGARQADMPTNEESTDNDQTPTDIDDTITLDLGELEGLSPQAVKAHLENMGFENVSIEGNGDTVINISPSGEQSADEPIVIETEDDETGGNIGDCRFPPCD